LIVFRNRVVEVNKVIMSVNDEILVPSSDSFWEIDGYKRTVKRTEDGMHMCNEMMKLISDRAEIEMKYANRLKSWSKKWSETIDKGRELVISIDDSNSLTHNISVYILFNK